MLPDIIQCTFGQECEKAEAYDNAHAEIVHSRNKSNIASNIQCNTFKVSSATINDQWDFENFCKIFDITPNTLVKTFANCKTKIDKLWKFIFENIIYGPCFCINIFVIASKAHVFSKKKLDSDEKQINDFHFGRHFFILIPIEKIEISCNEEIQKILQNDLGEFPDFLEGAGKILINYEEKLESLKICKFLANLFNISEKKNSICVSMSIFQNEMEKKEDCKNLKQEILTILAAKYFFCIIESKFPSEAVFEKDNYQEKVLMDELIDISQNIAQQLQKIKTCLLNRNPPKFLKSIYWDLKFFYNNYLKLIYANFLNIPIYDEMFEVLKEVCELAETTEFVVEDGYWVIKVDDINAEKVNTFTVGKPCIVLNDETKKYLKQLYNEELGDYYFVITTRDKMKHLREPMLYATDNKLYPIGIVDNDMGTGEITATVLYIAECSCKTELKKDKKVWMCGACKTFLFETKENEEWLKCNCGFHLINELDKRCCQGCSGKNKISRASPLTPLKKRPVSIRKKSNSTKIQPSKYSIQDEKSSFEKSTTHRNDDKETENESKNLKNSEIAENTETENAILVSDVRNDMFDEQKYDEKSGNYCEDQSIAIDTPDKLKEIKSVEDAVAEEITITPLFPDPKNIIFIGQTGAGKSTLINSIANYIEYNFEEACKKEMKCFLPCQFQLQTFDFKNVFIKAGPLNANEDYNNPGQSVTQKAQTYFIETKECNFNIIDTPGLGDSRGAEQDVINIEYIKNAIYDCGKLDAICFVIPSNITKLTTTFEMIMRDLLSLFPKTALKNVFFFFTYANSTFFSIGETRNPIDEFIEKFKNSNNAVIPFGPENIFCVDSEAFRFFIATKQGHKYVHQTEESCCLCWNKSKEAINNFLTTLKSIDSITAEDIQEVYDLEKIVIELKQEKDMTPDLLQLYNYIAEAAAQNSMTAFSSAFKTLTFKDFSKIKLKKALTLFQKAEINENLNKKIDNFLNKYFYGSSDSGTKVTVTQNGLNFNMDVHQKWLASVKECLKEVSDALAKLRENNYVMDKSDEMAMFDIYHANFVQKKLPENLETALNHFYEFSKKNKNKELQEKIEKVLFKISEKTF